MVDHLDGLTQRLYALKQVVEIPVEFLVLHQPFDGIVGKEVQGKGLFALGRHGQQRPHAIPVAVVPFEHVRSFGLQHSGEPILFPAKLDDGLVVGVLVEP